jgi:ATP-dependent Clp protease, protease subunit
MGNNKWFNLSTNGNVSSINIFGIICGDGEDGGVELAAFAEEFSSISSASNINVYINSPGGSLTDGVAIYNIIASQREKVTTINIGEALSIASIIFLAGKNRVAYNNSFYMIHNPSTFTWGTSSQLRKDADIMDMMRDQIIDIYMANSSLTKDQIIKYLDDETWFTPEEAAKFGLVTQIEKLQAVACVYNLKSFGFNKVPNILLREQKSIKDITIRDYEKILRDVGFSNSEATRLASIGFPKEEDNKQSDSANILLKEDNSLYREILKMF